MTLPDKAQEIWHDLYYWCTGHAGEEFAMNCRDVTAKIDLNDLPKDRLGRFRFRLHLTLCKACKNYLDLTLAFRKAIREQFAKRGGSVVAPPDLAAFNKSLLSKYTRAKP